MIIDFILSREPESINETLKMYKLQPESTESSDRLEGNLNSIQTVESVTFRLSDEKHEKKSEYIC